MFNPGMLYGVNLAPNCYAQWHFDESSGTNAADSSGHGRNGTTQNTPTWVAGKLNNCLNFVGTSSQYVDCGAIADFEYDIPRSYEFWFNTTTGTSDVLMKYNTGTIRGLSIDLNGGAVYFLLASSITNYLLCQTTIATYADGNWHHCIITYNGNHLASGLNFYVDGAVRAKTTVLDNLGASTVLNSINFQIILFSFIVIIRDKYST